jgi:hypothetical protein
MKAIINLIVLAVLLIGSSQCLAARSIGIVTKERAKEMGIELQAIGNGPNQVWVKLEFKPEGKLKDYLHVELEISDGNKSLVSYAPLQDRRDAGKVVVSFLADKTSLDKITLTVVTGPGADVGYQIRLKDFVEPMKQR